jgi:hypothetical protein
MPKEMPMVPESPESIPVFVRPAPVVEQVVQEVPPAGPTLHKPTEREALAIEAAFSQKPAGPEDAAALAWMWTAGLALHDVLKDSLTPPAGEEEAEATRRKHPEV